MSAKEDVEFLRAYLSTLQEQYAYTFELCPEDLYPRLEDDSPTTSETEERAARLADSKGFDGNLFRNLTHNYPFLSPQNQRLLERRIAAIPKIIAALEKPPDKSAIPEDAELLTVAQVATVLNCGTSEIYNRNKTGNLPMPMQSGANTSTLRWSKRELQAWINEGCPPRLKWERIKSREVQNGTA